MLNFIQIGLLIATSCHAIRSHPLTVHNAFDKSASNQQAAPTQFQELKAHESLHPFKFHSTHDSHDDDDAGFAKQTYESDKDGYHHKESFHKMDAGSFENGKNEGYGFSKTSDKLPVKGISKSSKKGNTKNDRPYKKSEKYQVREKDVELKTDKVPKKWNKYNSGTKFGFINQHSNKNGDILKTSKKPTDPKKKEKYTTVVYHETERGSNEAGYSKNHKHQPDVEESVAQKDQEELEAIRNADEEEYVDEGDAEDAAEDAENDYNDDEDEEADHDGEVAENDNAGDNSGETANENSKANENDEEEASNFDNGDAYFSGDFDADSDNNADNYNYGTFGNDANGEGNYELEAEADLTGDYTSDNEQYVYASEADTDATDQ